MEQKSMKQFINDYFKEFQNNNFKENITQEQVIEEIPLISDEEEDYK